MYNKSTDDQGYYYIRPKALNNGSNNQGSYSPPPQ